MECFVVRVGPGDSNVLDAVAYARQHAAVDDSRIYLVGCSGGGHSP
jgi:acetyl esterase/lipase